MNLAVLTRVRGRHERREAAGEAEADAYVTDLRNTAADLDDDTFTRGFKAFSERLASDTDIRAPLPLPLPPVRRAAPAARRYIPEACHCGKGWRGHIPDWVTEILHHATTAETVEAPSLLMQALTPDVLATLDAEASDA